MGDWMGTYVCYEVGLAMEEGSSCRLGQGERAIPQISFAGQPPAYLSQCLERKKGDILCIEIYNPLYIA